MLGEDIKVLGMKVAAVNFEHVVYPTGDREEQAFIDFVNADNEVILLVEITDTGRVVVSISERFFVEDDLYNVEDVVLFQSRGRIKFLAEDQA